MPPALVAKCMANPYLPKVTKKNRKTVCSPWSTGTHPHSHASRNPHQLQTVLTEVTGRRGPGRGFQLINATSEGTRDQISSNIFRLIVNFLHFHPSVPAPVGFTAESLLEFSEAFPKSTKAPKSDGGSSNGSRSQAPDDCTARHRA